MKETDSFKLPSQEEKAQYLQKNFNGISAAYDRFNDLSTLYMHRSWKKKLVEKSISKVTETFGIQAIKVLDLCCGTGDIAHQFESHLSKIGSLSFYCYSL